MTLGLYVHIPFCKSKCYYCDFLSFPKVENEEAYVKTLMNELRAYGKAIRGKHTISSIFIGGGTPTVLSPFLLEQLCACIHEAFELEQDVEFTIEANPGTITKAHAEGFKRQRVNRVSLGLQACQNHLLKSLGRIHRVEAWHESLRLLREVGITNINTDLMFGLPGQTVEDFKETLEEVLATGIPHVSAYGLIVEEGTAFWRWQEEGKLILPTEEEERHMYALAKERLKQAGYEHYEISNWAKPNQYCKQNVRYWEQGPYIGVGLGSHGYLDGKRYHNTYDFKKYLETNGVIEACVEEEEVITEAMQMEEFMFLGLRLVKGIDTRMFEEKFQKSIDSVYGDSLAKWINQGALAKNKTWIYLTESGRDISNQIMSEFLL